MNRRSSLVLAMLTFAGMIAPNWSVLAQSPEKTSITIGVGGKTVFYYLPLTIAQRRGYFADQGLDVTVNDFAGGSKALQAMLGGSVDVVTGSYEHTINLQTKGQDIRGLVELARSSCVLVVDKSKAGKIRTVADLKHARIGVSAPGSSTHFFALYLMSKVGLTNRDASFIGVGAGAGAVAALQSGELDALSNVDPAISKLVLDGAVTILADARSAEGSQALFGAQPPAAVLYAPKEFIDRYPATTQRLVNAFVKALDWLSKASVEEIAATVPSAYLLGDKALYVKALEANLGTFSKDGIPSMGDMRAALDTLVAFQPELQDARIDLSKTFDDSFAKRARKD